MTDKLHEEIKRMFKVKSPGSSGPAGVIPNAPVTRCPQCGRTFETKNVNCPECGYDYKWR